MAKLFARYSDLTRSLRDVVGYDMARFREIAHEHWRIIDAFVASDTQAAWRRRGIMAGRRWRA